MACSTPSSVPDPQDYTFCELIRTSVCGDAPSRCRRTMKLPVADLGHLEVYAGALLPAERGGGMLGWAL